MAGDKAKAAAGRKSKDKWKMKEWYNVHAPRMFNETVIGETPAADPEFLIGRQSEVTVQDLTGDFSKMHIKLRFKIVGYDGHEAKTELIGHDLTSDYVRRLTRRKKTKTDHVVDAHTGGKEAISPKESPEKLKAAFAEVLPEYDRDRVHVSDMKKCFAWYNTLVQAGFTEFKLPVEEEAK